MRTGIKKVKDSDVIMKAMELIGDPTRWTKNTNARNDKGVATGHNEPDACSFCMSGALRKIDPYVAPFSYVLDAINKGKGNKKHYLNLPSYNDVQNRSHEQVMNTMMTAAFLALADGK